MICSVLIPAGASYAASCETPQVREELINEEVFSTRAHIEALAIFGNIEPPPNVLWVGKYQPEEPGAVWTVAGEETTKADVLAMPFGIVDATKQAILHHLAPSTSYKVRFEVENIDCKLSASLELTKITTKPISKPEVPFLTPGNSIHAFQLVRLAPTSAEFSAQIESNGALTEYHLEYAPAQEEAGKIVAGKFIPFTSGGEGTITPSEDFLLLTAKVTGLTPEATFFVRLTASNGNGFTVLNTFSWSGHGVVQTFNTPTARPVVNEPVIRNVTGTTVHVSGGLLPNGLETKWSFQLAQSPSGPWSDVATASGTVSEEEAVKLGENVAASGIGGTISGLNPGKTYYVKLFASSAAGEGKNLFGELIASEVQAVTSFETSGDPDPSAFETHATHSGSIRILGDVNPHSIPTSGEQIIAIAGEPSGGTFKLNLEGQSTSLIACDASAEEVANALQALTSAHKSVSVEGRAGGPYTVYFGTGSLVGVAVPQMTTEAAGCASGPVTVTTELHGGEAYDINYQFEYVSERDYKEKKFDEAASTATAKIAAGDTAVFVGEDVGHLIEGETYYYRLSATSNAPGNPTVDSLEHTFTVPRVSAEATCAEDKVRSGASSNLPDCRAYEQVTPSNKEGSQEIFRYDGLKAPAYALVGEGSTEGAQVMVEAPVTWDPASGEAPYMFSRDTLGWSMHTGTTQPEAGVDTYEFQVFSPNLAEVGLEAFSSHQSKEIEYRVGPFGDPYALIATVPRSQRGEHGGLVAASRDFSKLVLQVEDHRLVEPKTTTKNEVGRYDLYEYVGGTLRQVNVGAGSCGAVIAKGHEETGGGAFSSPHAVSSDGSRVFFEAVPGDNCGEPTHLFVRIGGDETKDLGPYSFAAASADGDEVLMESTESGSSGLYLYTASTGETKALTETLAIVGTDYVVSPVLDAIYFSSTQQLAEAPAPSPEVGPLVHVLNIYRYDVRTQKLLFVAQADEEKTTTAHSSIDGRYYYFVSRHVGAVPAGASVPGGGVEIRTETEPLALMPTEQVFRYDSVEKDIECISCSSSFDPEPKLGANFGTADNAQAVGLENGVPGLTVASSNGDYAFFQTPAALVSADVDGEVTPEGDVGLGLEYPSMDNSASGDVYEWRRAGIDGCAQLQGCLALITNGRGGTLNLLLGSAHEGRDVFIYTSSQLVQQDQDKAGDIYDARQGGGIPAAAVPPSECEGDTCSTPPAAPLDTTPASMTFSGSGNVASPPSKRAAKKPKRKTAKKLKKKRKAKHRARRTDKGRGKASHRVRRRPRR